MKLSDLYLEGKRIAEQDSLSDRDKEIIVEIVECLAPYLEKGRIRAIQHSEYNQEVVRFFLLHFSRLQRTIDQFSESYWKALRRSSPELYQRDRSTRARILHDIRVGRHELRIKKGNVEHVSSSQSEEAKAPQVVDSQELAESSDGVEV